MNNIQLGGVVNKHNSTVFSMVWSSSGHIIYKTFPVNRLVNQLQNEECGP